MSFAHLSLSQRHQIQKQLAEGKCVRAIACYLGVDRSTVYRERARGQVRGRYCAVTAHQRALKRRARSAANHRTHSPALWRAVGEQLRQQWSPEQISGRWRLLQAHSVSPQAIYDWLERSRSALRQHLRHFPRTALTWPAQHGWTWSRRPSIRKRPAAAREREQAGHWEGDTIQGHNKLHCLVTAVERKSLYTCLSGPLPKQADAVARYIRTAFNALPALTLTLDNGSEFASYKSMNLPVFFADPGRPRQRSRNENTNGLIRQYVPKSARLLTLSAARIRQIAQRLNHRPRKTLGYRTPHEVLFNITPTPVAIRT